MDQPVTEVPAVIRIPRTVIRVMAWLSGIGIAVLMLPTVADVTYRKLLGPSIPGVLEYSEVGLVMVVFLGMASAMERRVHIYTPILTSRLPGRLASGLRLCGRAAMWAVVMLMVVGTTGTAIDSVSIGEYRFGLMEVPIWPARLLIPIGLVALLVELTIELYEYARRTIRSALTSGEGVDRAD